MSIHSGTISVIEIEKIYKVGYSYAQNIVNKLEEIEYVKKTNNFDYDMIQTEKVIDTYIREHINELRPNSYDILEWRNDGKPTLKSQIQDVVKKCPMFICRILISPFSILFTFLTIYSGMQAGAYFREIILTVFVILWFSVACNIVYNLYIAKRKGIEFKKYMLRPWLTDRIKAIFDINNIMRKNNVKFKFAGYYDTLRLLKIHLNGKKELAVHYADMANNAETENEFYQSINSCLEVLEWMSKFEKYGVYNILEKPSDDIKKIKDGMEISIERFNNRMKASGKISLDYDLMEGHDFEYFCAEVLRNNGFKNVEVTQGSGDHGIDILAEKDGISYAIQCKCYSSNIGNAAVQQAHTGKSLYHKDIAVVITNRYFTPQAIEEAAQLGVKLWDRDKLNEMINSQIINN